MAGPKKSETRKTAAKLLPMSTPDVEIGQAVVDMVGNVMEQAKGHKIKWPDLRITVLPSTADETFHQLRVGVHVEA